MPTGPNSCRNGGTYAARSTCVEDRSRTFSGAITPQLRAFEDRVIRQHFDGATVAQWERDRGYHLYHHVSEIAAGRTISMERIWFEYARRPAPTVRARDQPIRGGEVSIALTATSLGDSWLPIPLPGGPVRHYVDKSQWALINATMPGHVLHPGTIMRWFVRLPGSEIMSHTAGRGTGMMSRVNEVMGLEIFDELDQAVRKALSVH
jgi:hypothetical protein